ncbi:hypothetical protein [Paraburkholderia flagellata]|uniref:hypothetical protein n=1 Tax=Paraburkholderia flagellata TaxID=2883241 RepID=UPI001F20B05F|nr:hypothetical protein [Paraburkholderia flagellata]
MSLRGWDKGLAAAGLIIAVGVAVAQTPEGNIRDLIAIGITVVCAIAAIVLLRPNANEEDARQLNLLRTRTSDRDIAFLRMGASAITFPETLSRNSVTLAPVGEKWEAESNEKAAERAEKLISLRLMERRGSEVETSNLGRALIAFDDALKMRNQVRPE